MKTITLEDFLTDEEIQEVFRLRKAKLIKEKVIAPNLSRINADLGQENDPGFLAYACEYVINETERNKT